MSRKRAGCIAAMAAVCAALVGCAGEPVDERPVVRIVGAAQPSAAIPLGQFLPSAQELSATLGTGPNGFMGQLVEGDDDMLLRNVSDAEAAPAGCVSTAYRLQKVVYDSSPVQSVSSNSWAGGGFDGPPVSGSFGVVQMASRAAAQELFASLTENWRRCNGQTVTLLRPGYGADELSRIGDVVFHDQVVAATVLHAAGGMGSDSVSRALGVAADCIVDVEITDPRVVGEPSPATAVAQLILDKISSQR
jgi:hypothetical protein